MRSGQKRSLDSYLTVELSENIRELSHNGSREGIPQAECEEIARQTVKKMDFNDPYQMHKSVREYARVLVDDYYSVRARN